MMQVQQKQLANIQKQSMAGVTKYFEVIAQQMKELYTNQVTASHNTLDE